MTTPAERYAAFRRRAALERSELGIFSQTLDIELDAFQVEACEALQSGQNVLVAAPTGAGKTIVGEFAVHLGLASGRKAFYTTPIKALSNQKYHDLVRVHGPQNVGLLTGDTTINGEAPIVVMTTEVLRNMIHGASPTLQGLGYVVMDEVHYLADRFRGPVWEEVIILLPHDVVLVSLSATVSNAEEFGDWIQMVRGQTAVIVSEVRPVPLWQHLMVRGDVLDLYSARTDPTDRGVHPAINPDVVDAIRRAERAAGEGGARHAGGGRGRGRHPRERDRIGRPGAVQVRPSSRPMVVDRLDRAGLLPAIVFVFSRAGCEGAVGQVVAAGVRLTTDTEAAQIRSIVDRRTAGLPPEDLDVLGFWPWARALERGVAAHHAGLLPVFKETVEELFSQGLVKVVFATETLALGINMPARSVVLERLVKWDGREHAQVTPGEYTQLTGRAGRRGIDVEGHAVVLYSSGLDPHAVGSLASRRTYPLKSSFRPTYNMAVNLLSHTGRQLAREVLETSFAQFQADRSVVGLAKQAKSHSDALARHERSMTCERGDITAYLAIQRALSELEGTASRERSAHARRAAQESLAALAPGDVVEVPTGRRSGHAVVIEAGQPSFDGVAPTVVTTDRQVRRISVKEAPHGVRRLGSIRLPAHFNSRDARARRDLASHLRTALSDGRFGAASIGPAKGGRPPRPREAVHDGEVARLRAQLRQHPCHACPERSEHVREAARARAIHAEHEGVMARIEQRTASIARDFDRVCEVLVELGYLRAADGELTVSPAGRWLRRLYAERDLVLAECLRTGAWDGLDGAELAAVVTMIVYSSRGEESGATPPLGGASRLAKAVEQTRRISAAVESTERSHGVVLTPEVEPGLVRVMHAWAGGASLAAVLADADLLAGDFVRWGKQVIDVLDQVAAASPTPALGETARSALALVRRGVVAQEVV